MVPIKRIASGEAISRITLRKKRRKIEEIVGGRGRNKSEERPREFMFRTHGNLWAANLEGVGIGIAGKKMGKEDGTRCTEGGMDLPRATFRINSRIKWGGRTPTLRRIRWDEVAVG